MRRALVFALFMIPAVMWAGLHVWAEGFLARAELLDAPLSLASRLLLFASHWLARDFMFVMLVLMVTAPACSAAIAWAAGTLGETEPTKAAKALLMWWSVSLTSLVLFAVALKVLGARCPAYAVAWEWAALVSYSISLGSAFALQQQRVAAGHSTTGAGWLLAWGAWLFWSLCLLGLLFPIGVWVLWRRDVRRARRVAVRENAC